MACQALAPGIVQDVEAGSGERAAGAVLFAEDAVVRLLLQVELDPVWRAAREFGLEVFPQETHRVALVRAQLETQPKKVDVIGHDNVSGTEQLLSRRRVEQQLPEAGVEERVQPTGSASLERDRPKDGGESAVTLWVEAREVVQLRLGK
jgi:hypothetical protein